MRYMMFSHFMHKESDNVPELTELTGGASGIQGQATQILPPTVSWHPCGGCSLCLSALPRKSWWRGGCGVQAYPVGRLP